MTEKFHQGYTLPVLALVVSAVLAPMVTEGEESLVSPIGGTEVFRHPYPHVLDGFGMSIAERQEVVLVGTPNRVHGGYEAGMAYQFDRTTGRLLRPLALPRPTGGALFGQSVALNGDAVVIGAPHSLDGSGTFTGGVYVFDQLTGKHRLTIVNPRPLTGTFGHAVAMSGRRMVVGDPQASTTTTYYTGAAYVFDVASGERLFTLRPSKPKPGKPGGFGHAVAFTDSMIAIGAPGEQRGSIAAGVVYGFNAETGAFVRSFVSPDSSEGLFFGWSIALREEILLIGGFGYRGTYRDEGIVYVFRSDSGKLIRTLHNPRPHDGAQFGKTVAISSHFLIVGAPGDMVEETGLSRGAIYLFDRVSGTFLKKVVNPEKPTGADDLFGATLAAGDHDLFVGAPFGGSGNELDAGLVYKFELATIGLLESSPPVSQTVTPALP